MQNTTLLPISEIVNATLLPNTEFKAGKDFYKIIGINKHRFYKILKSEIDATRGELFVISNYFNIPITAFFTSTTQDSKEQSI